MSLGPDDQRAVSAAGTNHDGRAVRLFRPMHADPDFSLLEGTVADRGALVPQVNPLRLARLILRRRALRRHREKSCANREKSETHAGSLAPSMEALWSCS